MPRADSHGAHGQRAMLPRAESHSAHGAHRERAVVPRVESHGAHRERAVVSTGREPRCPGQRAAVPTVSMGRELRCPGQRATVPTGREPRCPGQRAMVPMGRQPQCPRAELQGPSGHTPGALCSASPARPLRQTAAPAPLPHSEDMRVDVNKTGRASGLICTDQAPSGQGCGLWAIRLSNLGGGQRALQHPVFSLHQMESSSTCCPHMPLPCGACGPHAPWTQTFTESASRKHNVGSLTFHCKGGERGACFLALI